MLILILKDLEEYWLFTRGYEVPPIYALLMYM